MTETLQVEIPPPKPPVWHRRKLRPIFAASLILAAYLAIDWYRASIDFAELAARGEVHTRTILTPYQFTSRPAPAWAIFLSKYVPHYLLPAHSRIRILFLTDEDAPFLNRVGKTWGTSQFDKIDQLTMRGRVLAKNDFAALRKTTTLQILDVTGTKFSDTELIYLQSETLNSLNFDNTLVTANGLATMRQFPLLKFVSVRGLRISPTDRQRIQLRHPQVQFFWE